MATAKKEVSTVEQKLRDLFDLQTVDSNLDKIQILKGELPMEVEDLEDDIKGLETRIAKLNKKIDEIEGEISNHKNNIATSETLIERYKKQLDEVKNNREFEALTKEIELQELEIQLSNKKIGELQGAKEAKTDIKATSDERLAGKHTDLENKKVELEKIIAKTEKEEKTLHNKSAKARKSIEERLLKSYDKIRKNYRNGLAVVTVERNACGGCYNRIPPQIQIEIGMRKNIVACEHCGRILVDNEIAGIEPPE